MLGSIDRSRKKARCEELTALKVKEDKDLKRGKD